MIPFTTVNEGDKAKMGLMSNSLMLNVQMLWKKYTLTPLTFHVLVNIYQFIFPKQDLFCGFLVA